MLKLIDKQFSLKKRKGLTICNLAMVWTILMLLIPFAMHMEGLVKQNHAIPITNKVLWNDVTVTYDVSKIKEHEAQKLFKAQFDKYGEKLKALDIAKNNSQYQVTADMDDGHTIVEITNTKTSGESDALLLYFMSLFYLW